MDYNNLNYEKFNNHFQYSIELTSVLQILFAASTIKKISKNGGLKPTTILVYVANKHVNQTTIDVSLSLLKKIEYFKNQTLVFCDMRTNRKDFSCEIAIVRTRVNKYLYNFWCFDKKFFINIGNCDLLKTILIELQCKKIIGIDDGLSNWRTFKRQINYKIILLYQFFKGIIYPQFLSRLIKFKNTVEIYSIFKKDRNNIHREFTSILSELSLSSKQNNVVKNLFISSWPSIGRDNSLNQWQVQMNILVEYLDKINWNPKHKIYIKKHPKIMKTELIKNNVYNFEYLPFDNGFPTEVLLSSMKNLNIIFSFPTTTAFLIKSKKINSSAKIEIINCHQEGYFQENLEVFNNV